MISFCRCFSAFSLLYFTTSDQPSVAMIVKRLKPSLCSEEEVRHAWVGACEAGDLVMVSLLLPVVELGEGGVNCTDRLGMTGLMAALETAQLDVVQLLLGHKDINMDFTVKDTQGRTALDFVISSKSAYFIPTILDVLEDDLEIEEFQKVLLLRLETCGLKNKMEHFVKLLDYFDINYKEGALLSTLISQGNTKFIVAVINQFKHDIVIQDSLKRSLLMALRSGKTSIVRPLFHHFKHQIKNIFKYPNIFGSPDIIPKVKGEIFTLLFQDILKQRNLETCHHCKCSQDSVTVKTLVVLSKDDEENFMVGLGCIDVNQQGEEGNTLLIQAVKVNCLVAVKAILQVGGLDVNHMNKAGQSALDFIDIPLLKEQDRVNPCFQPVMNSVTMKPLSTVADKTCSIDLRVMFLFQARQQHHKDIDFNFTEKPLLVRALEQDKLDLARFLLTDCNYKVTAGEMEVARRLLGEGRGHLDIRRGLQDMLDRLGKQEGVESTSGQFQ